MQRPLKELQKHCLDHRLPFVSFRVPGAEPMTFIAGPEGEQSYPGLAELTQEEGFLLAPFPSPSLPLVVIPPFLNFEGWAFPPGLSLPVVPEDGPIADDLLSGIPDIGYIDYSQRIEKVKESIRLGIAEKVVFSRTRRMEGSFREVLPDFFAELCRTHPLAFVYLLHTRTYGTWIGATPESLLQLNENGFTTMALAATKAYSGTRDLPDWNAKEKLEQNLVLEHIRGCLNKGGYPFRETPVQTVRAGNVVHLQSLFSGSIPDGKQGWKELADILYPTPAICGTTTTAALKVIREAEAHPREIYTGFLGPFSANGTTSLFVNLRCMKVLRDSALLFAGGGILEESSAGDEWKETELKMQLLLDVLDRVTETGNV